MIGRILKIYQPLQIMSDTEPTCDREGLDRELVTLTVKLLSLSQDLITAKLDCFKKDKLIGAAAKTITSGIFRILENFVCI